jgi:dihydroorotate dehydrogenase (fumarate)
MNLQTTYLGLKLANPLIIGASPLADDPDRVRELVDAGAAALVMHSLFQEQLDGTHFSTVYLREMYADSPPRQEGFIDPASFRASPEQYLAHIERIKRAVDVPVIGSLNGSKPGGWIRYATHIEQAGADALELNLYAFPSDPAISGWDVEQQMLDIIRMVAASVRIPVAIKLSPFLSSLPHFAAAAHIAGASGLVLFNRVYQAEDECIAPQQGESDYHHDSSHLQIRLYWLAVMALHLKCSLAISGGVHGGEDIFKAVKAGAHAGQVVSEILRNGASAVREMLSEFEQCMREQNCNSIEELRGRTRFEQLPDPETCERIRYMRTLQKWPS